TALRPGEIVCEIRVRKTPGTVAYVKTPQKASGFALAGAAAVVGGENVRVAITGVSATPYRAAAVGDMLRGQSLTAVAIRAASGQAASGVELLGDIHASVEYRAHLARVNTERALAIAGNLV